MTADREFSRMLAAWLREESHEDPGAVLARVGAIVAREPQARRWPWSVGVATVGRTARVALAASLVVVAIALGGALLGPSVVGPIASPSPTTSPLPSPATTAPASSSPSAGVEPSATPIPVDPAAPAVANDEPCTRTLPSGSLAVTSTPFHHEDLERMVLAPEDVGGLAGFEPDPFGQGYHDNAELSMLVPNPSTTCDDLRRFGRIEGYADFYSGDAGGVMFSVHLFWSADEAAAWSAAFTGALAAGAKDGGYTWTTRDLAAPEGGVLAEHVGRDGTRTWAIFRRGPIVGWVVDLRPTGAPTIDVAGAAAAMADRIDTVTADVARRVPAGLDAARLLSAPLPRAAYGDLGEGLVWDPFFGGCQDALERGFIAGATAREDALKYGRVTGCTAMYAPEDGVAGEVVRVFSSVSVHRDATGAAGALGAVVAAVEARRGVRFDAGDLGDEAVGVAAPATGAGDTAAPADTRVVLRIGALVLNVSVQGPTAVGKEAYVLDLARQLDVRVRTLLSAGG